tara:strand:+ start:79 stop:471 length:393 start_codon:yes stop_codon:yes gene_type:complete
MYHRLKYGWMDIIEMCALIVNIQKELILVIKNKKVILVGFPDPVKLKSKKYVIEKLYEKARKNPFLVNSSYKEYLEFLIEQMETLSNENIDIDIESKDVESKIYDTLKKLNWLKVINAFIVGVITTNIGV